MAVEAADFHSQLPDAGIFADVDNTGRTAGDLLTLVFSIPGHPPMRHDLPTTRPSTEEIDMIIDNAERRLAARIAEDAEAKDLVERHFSGGDEARRPALCVVLYTMDIQPLPVYKWVNAWLDSKARTAADVAKHIGPFFVEYTKALKLLPEVTTHGARAVRSLERCDKLRVAFRDYKQVFAAGQRINFWGITSFSEDDEVASREDFCGPVDENAIVFCCSKMTGRRVALLSAHHDEAEIQPLPPSSFAVVSCCLVQHKLMVTLEQVSDGKEVSYDRDSKPVHEHIPTHRSGKAMELRGGSPDAQDYYNLGYTTPDGQGVTMPGGTVLSKQQLYLKAIELRDGPPDAQDYYNLGYTTPDGQGVTMPDGTVLSKSDLLRKAKALEHGVPEP